MINKIAKFFVIAFFLGLSCLFLKGYFYNKEIEDNKKETICKFTYCEKFPKTTKSFFKYNVNNKRYRNSYGRCPNDYDEKINKFFIMHYSSKDPNKIEVDFSKNITDTTAILKAGFSREDIKY